MSVTLSGCSYDGFMATQNDSMFASILALSHTSNYIAVEWIDILAIKPVNVSTLRPTRAPTWNPTRAPTWSPTKAPTSVPSTTIRRRSLRPKDNIQSSSGKEVSILFSIYFIAEIIGIFNRERAYLTVSDTIITRTDQGVFTTYLHQFAVMQNAPALLTAHVNVDTLRVSLPKEKWISGVKPTRYPTSAPSAHDIGEQPVEEVPAVVFLFASLISGGLVCFLVLGFLQLLFPAHAEMIRFKIWNKLTHVSKIEALHEHMKTTASPESKEDGPSALESSISLDKGHLLQHMKDLRGHMSYEGGQLHVHYDKDFHHPSHIDLEILSAKAREAPIPKRVVKPKCLNDKLSRLIDVAKVWEIKPGMLSSDTASKVEVHKI